MSRRLVLLVLLVASCAPLRGICAADLAPGAPDAVSPLLASYFNHPARYRRALLAAARASDIDALPTPAVLAVADARMRGGHFDVARELCAGVLARNPGEPWAGWARIGYAWASIGAGDEREARAQLAAESAGQGPARALAGFVLALLDGADGHAAEAEAGFTRAAASTTSELATAARLGIGLARYWAGDFAGARTAFTELASTDPAGPLADDARYGDARAALAAGDPSAPDLLRALAQAPASGVRARFSAALVDLAPRAVLHVGFERYRRARAQLPEAQVAAALDSDGAGLARAALRRLASAERDADAAPDTARVDGDPAPSPSVSPAVPPKQAAEARGGRPAVDGSQGAGSGPSMWGLAVLIAVAATALVLWRRASPARRRSR